jgi:tetratricopeptide (TPR) repeat protein
MHIQVLFQTISLTKSVAEYSGIVESIGKKIDRLMGAELECGLRTLKQATHSTVEQTSLLRDARSCFNKAISLEKEEERLVQAYLGLAVCHSYLGDETNAKDALQELLQIEFSLSWLKIIANNPKLLRDHYLPITLFPVLSLLSYFLLPEKIRWEEWNKFKDTSLLKTSLTDSQLKCIELQHLIYEYLDTIP